jgi:putative transposase
VPYRNIAHPPISVWELRELRRKLHEIGTAQIDEPAIFAAYERLRDREARAASETKRIRRARERRPVGANAVSADETIVDPAVHKINLAEIKPFEVEEEP